MSTVEEDFLIRQRGHHDFCRCWCGNRGAGHGGGRSGCRGCVFRHLVFLCLEFSAFSNVVANVFAVGAAFSLLICALAFVPLTLVLVLLFLWFLFPILALVTFSFSFSIYTMPSSGIELCYHSREDWEVSIP